MSFLERHGRTLLGLLVFVVILLILIRLIAAVAGQFGVGLAFVELPVAGVLALVVTRFALNRWWPQPKP